MQNRWDNDLLRVDLVEQAITMNKDLTDRGIIEFGNDSAAPKASSKTALAARGES
jgi:hypothetical protein